MAVDRSLAFEPISAPQMLFARAAQLGARPRFMLPQGESWRAVTWNEFADSVARAGAFLHGDVLAAGQRAAVLGTNSVEWLVAALAIQTAGGVMVPIYPASTEDQIAYVIGHSAARVLFVGGDALVDRVLRCWSQLSGVEWFVVLDDTDVVARARALAREGVAVPEAAELQRRVIGFARVLEHGGDRIDRTPGFLAQRLAAIDPDASALMLYTSGTTGRPKGVPLSHRNLAVNQADWVRACSPLIPDGAVDLLWLPFSHIFGFGEACIGTALGFTTYFAEPSNVLERMPAVRPDVFMSVPAYWEKIAAKAMVETDPARARAALQACTGGRLRFCLSGGAGLARAVKESLYAAGVLVIEGYGLTETSPTLTLNRPDAFRFDSVGRPLPSVELQLADDGEILARGPSVFRGYHDDPEATAAAFTDDGWFKTGDVGRWTEDGFLQIIDRKKEILVTAGGKNVPPANIERLFADDPVFRHVLVYGDGKKYLVAGVWLDDEVLDARVGAVKDRAERTAAAAAVVQAAVDRVNTQLASFEQIKRFRVFEAPLTVAGGLLTTTLKVRRKQVYASFRDGFEELYA
ncbi:MAG: long-chain fatty acid--CoA ligase [Nannocystaceae bacterium]|nr:long-chain fatty acid--CoA ligase [Nannocystaceae bacterium]